MATLTVDLWLKELADARRKRPDDPGMSLWELAEQAGVSTRTMMEWLRQAHRRGYVKVGTRESVSIIGRKTWTPVYIVQTPPKKSRR